MLLAMTTLFLATVSTGAVNVVANSSSANHLTAGYANLPISFEANIGQADSAIEFLAHGHNGNLFLTCGEAWLTL